MSEVSFDDLPNDVNRIIQDNIDGWVKGAQEAGFLPPPHFVRRGRANELANFYREGQREVDALTKEAHPPVNIITSESIIKDLYPDMYYPTRRIGLVDGTENADPTRTRERELEGRYVIDGSIGDPNESCDTWEPFEPDSINCEVDFTIYNPNWQWRQLSTHTEWFGRIVAHGMRVPVFLHHAEDEAYFYICGYPRPIKSVPGFLHK